MKSRILFIFPFLCIFAYSQERPALRQLNANLKTETKAVQVQQIQDLKANNETAGNAEVISAARQNIGENLVSAIEERPGNSPSLREKQGDTNSSPFESMKGKRELTSKRDMFSKTYDNGDGSYTALIGAGPIHYEKNGQFLDIDHSITVNFDQTYPYINASNLFQSHFGSSSSTGIKNKSYEGELREFLNTKMYWEVNGQPYGEFTAADVPVEIEDNKAYYRNLYGSIDAEFTVLTGKRELNYIIPNKQALGNIPAGAEYLVFSEEVELPLGWTHQVTDKGIVIKNALGQNIYLYSNPISKDAGETLALSKDKNTLYETRFSGKTLTIKTKVKTEWLLSNERVYPIKVDPTVNVNPNASTYWTGWSTVNGGNNDTILAGNHNGGVEIAGFAKYNLSAVPNGSTINSVTSNLYYYLHSSNPTGHAFRIVDINTDPVSAVYWSDIINSSTLANLSDNYTFPNTSTGYKVNTFTNDGIAFVQNALSQGWVAVATYPVSSWGTDVYAWFYGYSANSNRLPYLAIDYTVSGCPPPSSLDVVNITKNSARFTWSQVSAAVNGYHIYWNTSGTAPNSGTTASASVNSRTTTQYNTGNVFSPNTVYYFWVRSRCSGGTNSTWEAGGYFNTLPDYDCIHDTDQGQIKGAVQEDFSINSTGQYKVADDFSVPMGKKMKIKQVTMEVTGSSSPSSQTFTLNFRNIYDLENIIATVSMQPTSTVQYATYSGRNVYHLTFDLSSSIELYQGSYRFQPQVAANYYWRKVNGATYGVPPAIAVDDEWDYVFTNPGEMVFFIAGDCEDIEDDGYCMPYTEVDSFLYLTKIRFIGSLNDMINTSTYSDTPKGYQDFTGLTEKPIQAQGDAINLSYNASSRGRVKAWIDWNDNGIFGDHPDEVVYDTGTTMTASSIFGFVIPEWVTPNKDYRLRIRIQNTWLLSGGDDQGGTDFSPCEPFTENFAVGYGYRKARGEAEDYLIHVIPKCDAKVLSVIDGEVCTSGSGKTELSATGSPTVTGFNWYENEFGGAPLNGGTPTPVGTPWETGSISETTTYWVTGVGGGCESTSRKPVVARVSPTAEIDFVNQNPQVCGEDESTVNLLAYGDKEQKFELDEENFNSPNLGQFTNQRSGNNSSNLDWKQQTSNYTPIKATYTAFQPLMASGYPGDKFATSIMAASHYTPATRRLYSKTANTMNFEDLTLRFDLFFFSYHDGGSPANDYFAVELSTNGGSTYPIELARYTATTGTPNRLAPQLIDMDDYIDEPNLRIRFVLYSSADNDGWVANAAMLDNIKLYGNYPLTTPFDWEVSDAGSNIDLYQSDCETELSGPTNEVCLKATEEQLEGEPLFKIEASTVLNNGCPAMAIIEVANMTKVWNPDSGDDWDTVGKWRPVPISAANLPPTADHCVIVKKKVNVNTGTDGVGRNLVLKSNGQIFIKDGASLTITDFIKSDADAEDFVVETDGNLLQINDDAVHTAPIRAERYVSNIRNDFQNWMDYIYWSSPVAAQNLHTFSPGTPPEPQHWAFLEYDESTDYFENTGDTNFLAAKGYAIRAEDHGGTPYNETYAFEGVLNNGVINHGITRNGQGYNLVGNPYPSDMDAQKLFDANPNIHTTVFFWTNEKDYEQYQQGSSYSGNNYAIYNGTGGTPATTAGTEFNAVDQYIKIGQGFIVQKTTGGGGNNLTFNNEMRVTDATKFYSKEIKDRFWLTLHTPENILNTTLIGYIDGATDGYEADYDTEFWGASDAIYSLIPGRELIIQGRQHPLNIRDVVPLGVKFHSDGVHVIRLEQPEGEFIQIRVYLIDKELGYAHDLSAEPYKFFAYSGKYHERFEIRYRKAGFGTSANPNIITAATQKEDIIILSTQENIREVQLFDVLGMEVYQNVKVDGRELRIPASRWMNSILFARIITEDGEVTTTKVLLK